MRDMSGSRASGEDGVTVQMLRAAFPVIGPLLPPCDDAQRDQLLAVYRGGAPKVERGLCGPIVQEG